MKCPIFSAAIRREYGNNPLYGYECLKKECVWWNKFRQDCKVGSIQEDLTDIVTILKGLLKAMPFKATL